MATEPEELKEYEYEYAGGVYTVQLTPSRAEKLGYKPAGTGEAQPKAAGEDSPKVTTKRRTAENKAVTDETNKSE